MSKAMPHKPPGSKTRYEFRVWGKQKEARRRLTSLAEVECQQTFDDRYLLVADPAVNAKIRGKKLKIKRLLGERHGFQRWASDRERLPHAVDSLDELLTTFDWTSSNIDGSVLLKAKKAQRTMRPVVVSKERRLFHIGPIRAEATTVIFGKRKKRLRTVAIESAELEDLVGLRSFLGLTDAPNLPFHLALDQELR